jgi:hypothetical protein
MALQKNLVLGVMVVAGIALHPAAVFAQDRCNALPDHAELEAALIAALEEPSNAGLGNEMWATVVDRDGVVCAVVFSGRIALTNGSAAA